jgi:hypothetical protein
MAVTVTSPSSALRGWVHNATSADASGCEEIKAAGGAGTEHVIEKVMIASDSAISVTLGAGETAGAVTTALIGPVTFAAGQTIVWDFTQRAGGILVGSNTAITFDASGAGNVTVFIQGTTK